MSLLERNGRRVQWVCISSMKLKQATDAALRFLKQRDVIHVKHSSFNNPETHRDTYNNTLSLRIISQVLTKMYNLLQINVHLP
jgi:hypothetical protein